MATLDPLQRAALEQAALWRARLNADAVGDADRQAWQTWHDAHEQHRWAWQQVAQVQQRLGQLPAGLAGRALDLSTQRAAVGRRGVVKGMLLLARDVSELNAARRELERLSLSDPLTGLGNELSTHRYLSEHLSQRAAMPLALLWLDLDGFRSGSMNEVIDVNAEKLKS